MDTIVIDVLHIVHKANSKRLHFKSKVKLNWVLPKHNLQTMQELSTKETTPEEEGCWDKTVQIKNVNWGIYETSSVIRERYELGQIKYKII